MMDEIIQSESTDQRKSPPRQGRNLETPLFVIPERSGATDRSELVEAARRWTEDHAESAIAWYLTDKNTRRTLSRLLRALTVALVTAGGITPLVGVAVNGQAGGWGYVLLAAAAGCGAFDHFFGVSSGWMRDMVTAQAIQRRLTEFRLAWAAELLERSVARDDATLAARLDLIRRFALDVADLVEAETAEWLAEFRSTMSNLYNQVGLPARGQAD